MCRAKKAYAVCPTCQHLVQPHTIIFRLSLAMLDFSSVALVFLLFHQLLVVASRSLRSHGCARRATSRLSQSKLGRYPLPPAQTTSSSAFAGLESSPLRQAFKLDPLRLQNGRVTFLAKWKEAVVQDGSKRPIIYTFALVGAQVTPSVVRLPPFALRAAVSTIIVPERSLGHRNASKQQAVLSALLVPNFFLHLFMLISNFGSREPGNKIRPWQPQQCYARDLNNCPLHGGTALVLPPAAV